MISKSKTWSLRAFLTKPVVRYPTSFDQPFGQAGSVFWGAYYTNQQVSWLNTDLYYLGLQDQAKSANQRKYSTFGLRLFKNPRVGEFDYEIESDWQTGHRGTREHFAHFQHVEAGYTFNRAWQPRAVALYEYYSGTANPNGNYDQTFDGLFGARRFDMIPTGVFGPFFRSNTSQAPACSSISSPDRGFGFIPSIGPGIWLRPEISGWGPAYRIPRGTPVILSARMSRYRFAGRCR